VFDKQALIFDDRDNRGANIDSWILEQLMRRAWMYWQPQAHRHPHLGRRDLAHVVQRAGRRGIATAVEFGVYGP
jgi:tricorn protease